jgi:hypothetical protein
MTQETRNDSLVDNQRFAFLVSYEPVGEEGFGTGAFVAERQRRFPGGQTERHTSDILGGLFLE